jgi:autotransporter-associated beta strand protein
MDRRRFLQNAAGASAGLIIAPGLLARPRSRAALQQLPQLQTGTTTAFETALDPVLPFVDHYMTNVTGNLTPSNNAAVDILTGMVKLWRTGSAWDNGVVLAPGILHDNMLYCVDVTKNRTEAQDKECWVVDRQDQSYDMINGMGPLAPLYKTGAMAVTSITLETAPDGTPPTTVSDMVPPGAPPGSAIGPGSTTSALGKVATLVNTLRGPYSSSNPAKFAYNYPRPWRMNNYSEVIDTGNVDPYGYPIYESDVIVVPQLLRQRGTDPTTDGGYVSGHTNALFLAGLAYAYAVPERFQELYTRALEIAEYRILAGMHSTVDVIGGRILATALAAAILHDPANATAKAEARSQALAYFTEQTGTTVDTLYAFAHSAGLDTDPYADHDLNARKIAPFFTYILPRRGPFQPMVVPKGAEVLLETRQPYLDAGQRREVLRTTALPSGYVLLDGPEQWGRLNLFAAADGYGKFAADVRVTMDAAQGGFNAADTWRNDISGPGGLVKRGTGSLTLTGDNRYAGGTQIQAGTLVAGSPGALGRGDVKVGGTLRLAASPVRVRGGYTQSGTLSATLDRDRDPALAVEQSALLHPGSVLTIQLANPRSGAVLPVIRARRLRGRFDTITVSTPGYKATPIYTRASLRVLITQCDQNPQARP